MTALTGLSGSGKTAIMNILARFWEIKHGRITIGGIDIKEFDYENLLHTISFVFQYVFLFNGTILNNIRLGREDAHLEEVYRAAERAGCTDCIMQSKNSCDTVIGEAGLRLSGGEKQRISIARTLLKNAPIVLSDEVTANVDSENEAKIHAALQELLKDKTVISIARNLAALRHARQIPVIENGSIVRRGTHDSLIREDGRYKELRELSEN